MSIYFSALAATVVSGAFYGYVFIRFAAVRDRGSIVFAALLTALIAVPVVAYVAYPLAFRWYQQFNSVALLLLVSSIMTPLIEESAKWSVLFLPWVRRTLRTDNAVFIALAIGFGFAIAEFWTQAHSLSGTRYLEERDAEYYVVAWPLKGLISPFVHGGFVLFVASRLATGRPVWPGALLGITMHWLSNLASIENTGAVLGSAQPIFAVFAILASTAAVFFVGIAIIKASGLNLRETLLGKPVACPSCQVTYDRPWTGLNFWVTSYEQCPHCRTRQWVRRAP